MPGLVLVKEKKYEGKYVAMESFVNHRVVASGEDPMKVTRAAEKKGVRQPVIIFVPKGNMAQIY